MSEYFSDRENGPVARTAETVTVAVWAGILSHLDRRIVDGSLGYGFPLQSDRGDAVRGTDEGSLWHRAMAEIPRLRPTGYEGIDEYFPHWRPRVQDLPPTDAILDLIELVAQNVGSPWDEVFWRYDRDKGIKEWVSDINRLFARNGLVYEITDEGKVVRLLPKPVREIFEKTDFETGDKDADGFLKRAVALIVDRSEHAHFDALEKLWKAFERIKTFDASKKSEKLSSANRLLQQAEAPCSPIFNRVVFDEFFVLTSIGNSTIIRHSETYIEPIHSRREAEYLFFRMFFLLRYVLLQTGRIRQDPV